MLTLAYETPPYKNISLRPNSKPSFINMIKILNNKEKNWWISGDNGIKNRNISKKNWFYSTQIQFSYQKLLKFYMKHQSKFHHKSLHRMSLFLKLSHPLKRSLNILVWTSELKQQNSDLNQHLKITLIRSKLIMWKESPPLT